MGLRYQVISEGDCAKIIDVQERRVIATFMGKQMTWAADQTAARLNRKSDTHHIREIEWSDDH
jgi:hypothetical protein